MTRKHSKQDNSKKEKTEREKYKTGKSGNANLAKFNVEQDKNEQYIFEKD